MLEIIFLLGVIIGLIINNVYWKQIKSDGTMLVIETDEKDVFNMIMNKELDTLKNKKIVVFRVKKKK